MKSVHSLRLFKLSHWGLIALIACAGLAAGCANQDSARRAARQAGGPAALPPQAMMPVVVVRGEVRNPVVPWEEGLTLARALVMAEYRGITTPREIIITRRGQRYTVRARDLLNGSDNPLLEPSDGIEVRW